MDKFINDKGQTLFSISDENKMEVSKDFTFTKGEIYYSCPDCGEKDVQITSDTFEDCRKCQSINVNYRYCNKDGELVNMDIQRFRL